VNGQLIVYELGRSDHGPFQITITNYLGVTEKKHHYVVLNIPQTRLVCFFTIVFNFWISLRNGG